MDQPKILQYEKEIADLADLVKQEGCRSFLEIGSKFGGSLWRIARVMPKGSLIVSVDLPKGTKAWKESEPSLKSCVKSLSEEGYVAHLIWGDSTDPRVVKQVDALGPFDLVFIDADHTLKCVSKDWDNYGSKAKIVAFHDIAWARDDAWKARDPLWNRGIRIEVPVFWSDIKKNYRHVEFVSCPTEKNNGIGVLWRS